MDIISLVAITHSESRRQRELATISSVSPSHVSSTRAARLLLHFGLPERS